MRACRADLLPPPMHLAALTADSPADNFVEPIHMEAFQFEVTEPYIMYENSEKGEAERKARPQCCC